MSLILVRWGGFVGMVAGVAYAVTGIVALFVPQTLWPGPIFLTSFSDYLVQFFFVVALLGTLVAIASLHALQRGSYGWTGKVGSLAAFFGHALLLYSAVETAVQGNTAGPGFINTGLLAALLGLVLLGLATLDARVLPRWCGLLLIVGFPLSAILGAWLGGWMLMGILVGIIWALVGYALLASGSAYPRQPARMH